MADITKRYRIKAQDDLQRINSMSKEEQELILNSTLSEFTYFSYDDGAEINKIANALKFGKTPFTRAEIVKGFIKRSEPIFKYLITIDNKDLYTEINRNQETVDVSRQLTYGLGLKRFEFHHVSDNKEFNEPFIKYLPNVKDIFFYKGGVDQLIIDILKKLKELSL
jgi:hypothetical protein